MQKESEKKVEMKNILNLSKSSVILKKIFQNVIRIKALEMIKHNKKLQKRLNINFNDYKEYSEIYTPIEIELLIKKNPSFKFINVIDHQECFHIFF